MQLRTAVLGAATDHAMQMLPLYTGLTALYLTAADPRDDMETRLYLTPLQFLPHLTSLHVEAEDCDGLHHLQHLTHLHITSAEEHSRERCPFVSSLRNLYLDDSSVYLDSCGIAALSQLTSLTCHDSDVLADLDEHRFCARAHETYMPADRALPCLVQLRIIIHGGVNAGSGLAWTSALASLTNLELQLIKSFTIDDSLTSLQRLSSLSLKAFTDINHCAHLYIHWQKMCSLQQLKLQGSRFNLARTMMEVIGHSKLQTISLVDFGVDLRSTSIFAALLYQLAAKRPDIVCYVDEQLPSEV